MFKLQSVECIHIPRSGEKVSNMNVRITERQLCTYSQIAENVCIMNGRITERQLYMYSQIGENISNMNVRITEH